ncbi:MAG: RNA-directed DNA polymerase [Glaciecola sp.]|jgi:RNA-directed DNA polymerase
MASKSVFNRRYMDDLIVLSPARWKLRKAIRTINQHFAKLKLQQHPDKTTIGRKIYGFKTNFRKSHSSINTAL